jgi:hypothetical protein
MAPSLPAVPRPSATADCRIDLTIPTIADRKPQGKLAHVPGVSLGRTHSNPINTMKNVETRSTRAME